MAEILHHLGWRLPHHLQGFIHPRWRRISSINSRNPYKNVVILAVTSLLLGESATSKGVEMNQFDEAHTFQLGWKNDLVVVSHIFILKKIAQIGSMRLIGIYVPIHEGLNFDDQI